MRAFNLTLHPLGSLLVLGVVLLAATHEAQAIAREPCSYEALRTVMRNTKPEVKGVVASELFLQCQAEFLALNKPSEVVTGYVDQELGFNLSSASSIERFQAYRVILTKQKPESFPENFSSDCSRMYQLYIDFRENTEPLVRYIPIELSESSSEDEEKISNDDLELLNYAQYSQLCSILLD